MQFDYSKYRPEKIPGEIRHLNFKEIITKGQGGRQEFLDNLGLGWKKGEKGRVIGPTDDCSTN